MMVLQTTFNRVAGLALGSSHFTFAMVVAVFVLCIALGSFAVSALSRIPAWLVAGSQWLLVGLLVGIYLADSRRRLRARTCCARSSATCRRPSTPTTLACSRPFSRS